MSFRFKSWSLAVLVIVLLSSGALAGCGDDGGGDQTPTRSGERIEGGELTVRSVEFSSLDPHFSAFFEDISLQRMLWRGLYTMDRDNVPQPAMASAPPDVSADGLTYTVKLRDGLKWSDGDDLTADDFVAGIHRTCNPDNGGQYEYLLANIAGCDTHYSSEPGFDDTLEGEIGVHAIGATTVEYKLIDPQPTFPIILSLWVTFPSPVHLLPNSSDTWPSGPEAPGELAYNGPYILTGYSSGDNVTLEPNPEWAAPAGVRPSLDRITIKFIDDLAVAANAYRSGEIDATGANVTQLDSLISEFGEGEEYFKSLSPATSGLYLQLEKPPLDKLDVRLALSRAIDRAEIARVVGQGAYEPTTTWIPETSGGLAPDAFVDAVGFDPEKARDNLTKAGFPNGEGFPELTILALANPSSRFTAEFLQQAFKTHLNIDVKIEVVDPPTQADLFFEEQYEITFNGWVQDYPDPENWVLGQFDSTGTANHVNCNDPDIDALVEKARFNPDDAERLGQYREINELIVTRLCGVIPTRHDNNHWLIKPSIVGMRENLAGQDGLAPGDWASEYWGLSE